MQYSTMIRQILEINSKAIEQSFDLMESLQDQGQKMLNAFCLEEAKKAMANYGDRYKAGLKEYRDHMQKRLKLYEFYLLSAVDQLESSVSVVVKPKNNESKPVKKPLTSPAAAKKPAARKKIGDTGIKAKGKKIK